MFIHTIDREPAYFSAKNRFIYRADTRRKIPGAATMRQVLAERRIAKATCAKLGIAPVVYGAIRVV